MWRWWLCGMRGVEKVRRSSRWRPQLNHELMARIAFAWRCNLASRLRYISLSSTRKGDQMLNTKALLRNAALAGALPLLVASSAFAQYGTYPGTYRAANRGYANRVVEGTVASVA